MAHFLSTTAFLLLAFSLCRPVKSAKPSGKPKTVEIKIIDPIIANDAMTLCLSQTTGILDSLKTRHGVTCKPANDPPLVIAPIEDKPLPPLPPEASTTQNLPSNPASNDDGPTNPTSDSGADTSPKPNDASGNGPEASTSTADSLPPDPTSGNNADVDGSAGLTTEAKLKTFDECFSRSVLSSETFAKNEAAGKALTKEDFDAAKAGQICKIYETLNNTAIEMPNTGAWAKLGRFIATKSARAFFGEWKKCAAEQPMRIDEFFCQDETKDKWKTCAAAKAAARIRKIKAGEEVNLTPEERQKIMADDLEAMAKEERTEEKQLVKEGSWMSKFKSMGASMKKLFSRGDKNKHKDEKKKEEEKPKSTKWYAKAWQWMADKAKKAANKFMGKFIGCDDFKAARNASATLDDTSVSLRRRRKSNKSNIACFSVMVLFEGIVLVVAVIVGICVIYIFTSSFCPGPHSLGIIVLIVVGIVAVWAGLYCILTLYQRFNCCRNESPLYCGRFKGSAL